MRVFRWFATVMDVQKKKIEKEKKDTHFETFIKNMFTNYMSSVFKKTTRECSHPQPPPPKNIVTDLNL